MLSGYLARQFSHPRGWLGRYFLPWAWNGFNRIPNETAFHYLDPRPDDRILDIGYGGGFLLGMIDAKLTDGFAAGLDHSQELVARGEKRFRTRIADGRMALVVGDAAKLPFADSSFTKICSVNSLFYWPDPEKVFSEILRTLKKDGKLVLCFTRRASLKNRKFSEHGLSLYEAEDVTHLLDAAGFAEIGEHLHSDSHREFWCVTAKKLS